MSVEKVDSKNSKSCCWDVHLNPEKWQAGNSMGKQACFLKVQTTYYNDIPKWFAFLGSVKHGLVMSELIPFASHVFK